MSSLNDPCHVRGEYRDESGRLVRNEAWARRGGWAAIAACRRAVADAAPQRVLEVGPGRGEMSQRISNELGAEVVAVDQSERMVERTRARGIDARLGDVQSLPFDDCSFDCAVAATNGENTLHELWDLFGPRRRREHAFSIENAGPQLARRFASVDRRDATGTITFPDWEAANLYVSNSVTRRDLAGKLPRFEGSLVCTRHMAIFVTTR